MDAPVHPVRLVLLHLEAGVGDAGAVLCHVHPVLPHPQRRLQIVGVALPAGELAAGPVDVRRLQQVLLGLGQPLPFGQGVDLLHPLVLGGQRAFLVQRVGEVAAKGGGDVGVAGIPQFGKARLRVGGVGGSVLPGDGRGLVHARLKGAPVDVIGKKVVGGEDHRHAQQKAALSVVLVRQAAPVLALDIAKVALGRGVQPLQRRGCGVGPGRGQHLAAVLHRRAHHQAGAPAARRAAPGKLVAVAACAARGVAARLQPKVQPLAALAGHDIDGPAHGARAIHRRGAAGQHLDPLHHGQGDGVQVGRGIGPAPAVGPAAAIDQHQGALGAQVVKVHAHAAVAVQVALVGARALAGQALQKLPQGKGAAVQDVQPAVGAGRGGACDIGAAQARAKGLFFADVGAVVVALPQGGGRRAGKRQRQHQPPQAAKAPTASAHVQLWVCKAGQGAVSGAEAAQV